MKKRIPPKSIQKPCFSLRDLFRSIQHGRFIRKKSDLKNLHGTTHSGQFACSSCFYVFFGSRVVIFFCLGAAYFFSEISSWTIFPASWTHLDRSGVPWSYRLLPSIGVLKSSNVTIMKKDLTFFASSHFFFTNLFLGHTIAAETFFRRFSCDPSL